MEPGTLAVLAFWLAGLAAICRNQALGRSLLGAAIALACAALLGQLD